MFWKRCLSCLDIYSPGYTQRDLNLKTKLLLQYSSHLQNFPLSLFGKKPWSSFPKQKIPSAPPQKESSHVWRQKKEMQCSVSRLLSISSGRMSRILRHLTTPGQHEKSQKSRPAIHLFLNFFFLPHKCIIVRFSFGYFVLVFCVNDLALLNHSINRPLTQKFLDSLWQSFYWKLPTNVSLVATHDQV